RGVVWRAADEPDGADGHDQAGFRRRVAEGGEDRGEAGAEAVDGDVADEPDRNEQQDAPDVGRVREELAEGHGALALVGVDRNLGVRLAATALISRTRPHDGARA